MVGISSSGWWFALHLEVSNKGGCSRSLSWDLSCLTFSSMTCSIRGKALQQVCRWHWSGVKAVSSWYTQGQDWDSGGPRQAGEIGQREHTVLSVVLLCPGLPNAFFSSTHSGTEWLWENWKGDREKCCEERLTQLCSATWGLVLDEGELQACKVTNTEEMLKKKWLVIVSWNTRRREHSTRWPKSKLKTNKTRSWVYNKIVKGCAEAKSASEFKKGWGELIENISIGTQGFEWNSHIRKFLNSCLLEVKKTYQEKVQPSHCPGCAHVPLLLATVVESPVLDEWLQAALAPWIKWADKGRHQKF